MTFESLHPLDFQFNFNWYWWFFIGTIGGIASVFYSLSLREHDYGTDWVRLFPAMAKGRSGIGQAVAQVAAMAATIGISCIGGLCTGLLMRAAGRFQFRKATYPITNDGSIKRNNSRLLAIAKSHQSIC